ncbi:MAG: ribonuclease HI family protein [Candidatus Obscuribacterales bacterium]|nr:ribonuclease HI family protein [Candidatus Obscuribacterales bacterium]
MVSKQAIVFADGGSRGNPGPSGAGALVKDESENGVTVASVYEFLGTTTNNVAEYTGLIMGLRQALELGYTQVEARMDSELVVKQIKGQYRVKNEKLKPLCLEAKMLAQKFERFSIVHIRREHNKEADRLANQAMDTAGSAKI